MNKIRVQIIVETAEQNYSTNWIKCWLLLLGVAVRDLAPSPLALRTLNPVVQITVQIALQIAVQNYVTELQIVAQCYWRNCFKMLPQITVQN